MCWVVGGRGEGRPLCKTVDQYSTITLTRNPTLDNNNSAPLESAAKEESPSSLLYIHHRHTFSSLGTPFPSHLANNKNDGHLPTPLCIRVVVGHL